MFEMRLGEVGEDEWNWGPSLIMLSGKGNQGDHALI